MAPAEIRNAQGQTEAVVSGDDVLRVTRKDGQEGEIQSFPPDAFGFEFEHPYHWIEFEPLFKFRRVKQPLLMIRFCSHGRLFNSLALKDGKRAIAITEEKAAALKRQFNLP